MKTLKLKLKGLSLIIFVLLMITVVGVGVGLAAAITVDGDGSEWVVAERIVQDPIDELVPLRPEYDVSDVYLTNDDTNLYIRMDTQSSPNTWKKAGSRTPLLSVCIDRDNLDSTGEIAPAGNCNFSSDMQGVDYIIQFEGGVVFDQASVLAFYDCTSWPCTPNGAKTANTQVGYVSGNGQHVTEISISLADLNLLSGNCSPGCNIEMALYFDNGDGPTEDSVPNSPPYLTPRVGDGSPTAITLDSLTARSGNVYAVPLLVGSLLLLAVLLLMVRRLRSRVS